jgi:hypothetical protein
MEGRFCHELRLVQAQSHVLWLDKLAGNLPITHELNLC